MKNIDSSSERLYSSLKSNGINRIVVSDKIIREQIKHTVKIADVYLMDDAGQIYNERKKFIFYIGRGIRTKLQLFFLLLKKNELHSFNLDGNCIFDLSLKNLLAKFFWLKGYFLKESNNGDIFIFESKKNVVYTAIFGGKDKLLKPKFIPSCFDFLCYSDSNLKSQIWRVIREKPFSKDPVRNAKIYKILPHKYLKIYDSSIWVDGNLQIVGNLNALLNDNLTSDLFAVYDHNQQPDKRNCIYDEAEALIEMHNKGRGKDDISVISKQIGYYKKMGYPQNYGLIVGAILLRKHNIKKVITLMDCWWDEISRYSRRDQLSCNYAAWRLKFKIKYINGNFRYNRYFRFRKHKKRKSFYKTN